MGAMTTGGASAFVPGDMGDGRVHIYRGADAGMTLMLPGFGNTGPAPNTSPAAPSSPKSLWDSAADLMKYESCSCHYSWFNSGPYNNEDLATWTPRANAMNDINATIVTAFSKG